MTVHVRNVIEAGRSEWERLWRGYQQFYGVDLGHDVTEATWRRLEDSAQPITGLGAFDGNRLVGIVHWVRHASTWMAADTFYLQDLFVVPEARGRGIARSLIEAVYAAADASGAGQVYWLTHHTNRDARRLYDRLAVNAGFILYERYAEAGPDKGGSEAE